MESIDIFTLHLEDDSRVWVAGCARYNHLIYPRHPTLGVLLPQKGYANNPYDAWLKLCLAYPPLFENFAINIASPLSN